MKIWSRSEPIAGFLDHGTSITGELQFSGILRLEGNFHGSIASADTLIVGEQAVVHADINVGELEIHGQVFGSIQVKRRTEISATGRLRGDLQTSTLVVQLGAVLDGRSRMAANPSDAGEIHESTHLATTSLDQKRRDGLRVKGQG